MNSGDLLPEKTAVQLDKVNPMSVMTNVLLRSDVDGTTDHTFYPVRDVPFPHWRTNVDGLPLSGQKRIESQFEVLKNGKTRVNVKIINPIMELIPAGTVNSAGVQASPRVADEESISITWFLSDRGNQDTRAELQRMVAHLMAGANATSGGFTTPVGGVAHSFKNVAPASVIPYAIANLLFPGG